MMGRIQYFKNLIKRSANSIVRQDKVAMLHPGRCGSTVLGSLMNQHPDIYWSGEPFEKFMLPNRSLNTKQVIEIIKNVEDAKVSKIYSFATKYLSDMHLSKDCINMNLVDYINFLEVHGYRKFIVIDRSNHLRRTISMQKGRETRQWHTTQKVKTISKVSLNVQKFQVGEDRLLPLIDYFASLDMEFLQLKEILKDRSTLFINYEQDIEENPINAFNKLCDYLNIAKRPVNIYYEKTNPFSVKDLVKNYVELERALRDSQYEWMLNN